MNDSRNHSAMVFLTTLSVCLGLVLVGTAAPLNAQTSPGNNNIRVMVRQSLYGNALEELVRELERLREEGESFDLENELSLLDAGTLLTFATLHDFASDYNLSVADASVTFGSGDVYDRTVDARTTLQSREADVPSAQRIPHNARPRASLDSPVA